jgi:hypothetical protein
MDEPHPKLEQAVAVLVETLGIGVVEAMSWLRAYASVTGRDLAGVARDVASERLRLSS